MSDEKKKKEALVFIMFCMTLFLLWVMSKTAYVFFLEITQKVETAEYLYIF